MSQRKRPDWRRLAAATAMGAAVFLTGWWLLQPGEAAYLAKGRVTEMLFAGTQAQQAAQPETSGPDYAPLAFAAIPAAAAGYGVWRLTAP